MKNLIRLMDWSSSQIMDTLNMADQLKYEQRHRIEHAPLKGRTLGMIFSQPSTRTRVSFEVGMYQLGGEALFLTPEDMMAGQGEPEKDNIRALSRYLDGVMVRTPKHEELALLAEYSDIPIINGMTDYTHPCQVMATLMTTREYKGSFEETKLCYIGNGNNVANAMIVGAVKTGMEITVSCPENYKPDSEIMEWAEKNGRFTFCSDPLKAAENADILYTSAYPSGKSSDFEGYQINMKTVAAAKPDVTVLHCLPAHKGEEITEEVFEMYADHIFDETENRLHVQKAILVKCFLK